MIILTASVYAKTDTVSIVVKNINSDDVCDTTHNVRCDSINEKRCVNQNSDTTLTLTKKKLPWYIRAYNFCDKILAPPRDSNYIDVQTYNWCAMAQLSGRFERYFLDSKDLKLTMSPDFHTRIGPFFGWRWAFLGYNIDLKSVFISGDDVDLGASIYSSAFGLDLFYRKVGGNYNIKKLTHEGQDYTQLLRGTPFNGINVGMTRISFYYNFNYKRYSLQAAFSQTNRQLHSAGSPIAGIQYAHNAMSLDWNKLQETLKTANNIEEDSKQLFSNIKNDEIALTGGYGYNWVFAKNWLAAIEVTGSIGFLIQKYKSESLSEDANIIEQISDFTKNNLSFGATARSAVLWNNGPLFAGLQSVIFMYRYGNSDVQTTNLLGTVYLYVGVNFNMKKSSSKKKKK